MIIRKIINLVGSRINAVKIVHKNEWFPILISTFLFIIFLFLTSEVRESIAGEKETIGEIDKYSLEFILQMRTQKLTLAAINLTSLGSGVVLSFLTLTFSLYELIRKRFASAVQILVVALGTPILTSILKLFFERVRPDYSIRLVDELGFSYPSGHSLAATAIYFTIAISLSRTVTQISSVITIWSLFISLILIIGLTRIYLGVHHASDVMAGILLGTVWASVVEYVWIYFHRIKMNHKLAA